MDEIVGRDAELAQIDEFLSSPTRALVLEGEAGIGKTTLWCRGLDRAETLGFKVLTCAAVGSEAQLAYTGLRDLLAHTFGDAASALPAPQRHALNVALLREEPEGSPPDRGAVAAAFLSTLQALARSHPVLVAIDDVRWLDASSVLVVAYAARRLRDEPVQLLLTARSEDPIQVPQQIERALDEQLRHIRVGPISVGALHRVFRARLGVAFPRPTLLGLWEASGGNPFFALELARAVDASGGRVVPGEPLPVPGRLHELVKARLEGLSEIAGDVLLAAAALTQPTVALVSAVATPDAAEQLEQAVAAAVLELDGGRVRFVHPLLATGVYSAADAARRREIHRRLAGLVEDAEERARHLALAAEAPSAEVAELLEEAARLARARGAPAAAAELAEDAARLTPEDRGEDELRRTIAAGGYYFEAGDPERARRLFGAAAQLAAPGPKRAQALWRLARAHVIEADHRSAVKLYREALVDAGGDVGTRIEAEAGLAIAMMRMLDDLPTAARHARAAVELAEAHGVADVLPEFKARQALIEALLGDPNALELALDAAELQKPRNAGGESNDTFTRSLGGASFMLGVLLQWADRFGESRACFESARARVLGLGDESSLPLIGRYIATTALLEGDWGAAARETDDAYEIAAQTGQSAQQAVLAAVKALVLAHRGDVDDARAAAAEAKHVAEQTSAMFGVVLASSALGLLELSLGNPVETDAHLAPLLEHLEAAGVREPGAMRFLPDEIEALILLDRLAEAETHATRLERLALELDRPSAIAAVYRSKGLLEAARGDHDRGLASFDSALAHHDRASMPFERARTLLALGSVQRRSRRKRAARDSLQQALALFESLGASLWAEKAHSELARVGGRAPSGDELTPTERRVAALVAEGLATKEVASMLFVSPKTVEGHLSHIYAKLGVRSRVELANRLAAGQRPTPSA
jgi:DNA-binding CsgD family transcriptional regulator